MILTSYLYVGVHYKKNNGVSSKLVPVSTVTLWIRVVTTNCCWKQWTVVEHNSPLRATADPRLRPRGHRLEATKHVESS
jgi:hypothetical protein